MDQRPHSRDGTFDLGRGTGQRELSLGDCDVMRCPFEKENEKIGGQETWDTDWIVLDSFLLNG